MTRSSSSVTTSSESGRTLSARACARVCLNVTVHCLQGFLHEPLRMIKQTLKRCFVFFCTQKFFWFLFFLWQTVFTFIWLLMFPQVQFITFDLILNVKEENDANSGSRQFETIETFQNYKSQFSFPGRQAQFYMSYIIKFDQNCLFSLLIYSLKTKIPKFIIQEFVKNFKIF